MEKVITPDLQTKEQLIFFAILAFIGGFVDASSFIMFETFTGHLTGNSILSVIYLAKFNWSMLALTIVSIIGFFLGTLGSSWLKIRKGKTTLQPFILLLALCLFTLVFSLYFFVPAFYFDSTSIFLISLSMGMQNGYFSKLDSTGVHTTYITGMTTNCIGAFLKKPGFDAGKKDYIYPIFCFVLGGFCGGAVSNYLGYRGFALVLIPLIIAVLLSFKLRAAEQEAHGQLESN